MQWVALALATPVVLSLGAIVGCRSGAESGGSPYTVGSSSYRAISPLLLEERLRDFTRRFAVTVQTAAEKITDLGVDRVIRRRSVELQLYAIQECRQIVSREHPIAALIDIWTFLRQGLEFLTEGEGKDQFGAGQPIVTRAFRLLEEDVEFIASDTFDSATFESMKAEVAQFASDYRIDDFGRRRSVPAVLADNRKEGDDGRALSTMTTLMSLPMAPFSAMTGVEQHAQAIAQFADVADRYATITMFLPQVLRWQIELLLYDFEDRDTTKALIEDLGNVSVASLEISQTAKNFPGEVRRQVSELLEEVAAEQGEVRQTLAEVRQTISDLDKVLGSGLELSRSAEAVATSATAAGESWADAMRAIGELGGDDGDDGDGGGDASAPPEEPGRPFDILEYRDTAAEIARASADLRQLSGQIQELVRSGEAVEVARRASEDILAQLMWRGMALIAVFFAAALVYRWIAGRLAGSRSPSGGRTSGGGTSGG